MKSTSLLLSAAVVMLMATPNSLSAQKPDNSSSQKDFKDLGYSNVIDGHKKDESKVTTIGEMVRLAKSFYKTGDYNNAARWYGQVVEKDDAPEYKLAYAQCLQCVGDYTKAKKVYLAYDAAVLGNSPADTRGIDGANACDNAANIPTMKGVKLSVPPFNSDKLDFSAVGWRDGVVFSSNRSVSRTAMRRDVWLGDAFMDLWFVPVDAYHTYGKPTRLKGKINSKYHEGTPQFDANGNEIWFSRNLYLKGKKNEDTKGNLHMGIYSAQLEGKRWTKVTPFAYNDEKYQYCHPSMSEDGTKLYFASDRPGGLGGMDLYVSEFTNGQWGTPKNLGANVNSAGNELFPFAQSDGTLWYASNGKPGLGGLDIFYTKALTETDSVSYQEATNIGKPFNSTYDDFSFWIEKDMESGYFTSNRRDKKNQGNDNIYEFKAPDGLKKAAPNVVLEMVLFVYDQKTNARLEAAEVTLSADNKAGSGTLDGTTITLKAVPNEPGSYYISTMPLNATNYVEDPANKEKYLSNAEGIVNYKLSKDHEYSFIVKRKGYKDAKAAFTTQGLTESKKVQFGIPLEALPACLALDGKAVNQSASDYPLSNVAVNLTNMCTGETEEIITDNTGEYHFCLTCGCSYTLSGDKKNFIGDKQDFTLNKADCPSSLRKDLNLVFQKRNAENPNNPYQEGMVIELKNVYYDFNKSNIRSDAASDLDTLVTLLKEHPDMEIELGSHTDARGSDAYNLKLSQQRADAAIEYIASKGIDRKRLKGVGYGETVPRKNCIKDCTELEFQSNRRTEVKITKLDAKNVRIRYADNDPTVINKKDGTTVTKEETTKTKPVAKGKPKL